MLMASGVATNVSCNGGSNGTVDLTVTGGTAPYTFVWSNTTTTEDMVGLMAGTYDVTVTDANGCTATTSVTVTEPAVLTVSITADTLPSCANNDGVVTATPTGGVAPYTYAWSNSATTASLAGLEAGTYSVTITDANGCTATGNITINIDDTENPTITCPGDLIVSNDGGSCGAIVTFTILTFDNCGGETLTQTAGLASGSTFPKGVTTNTYVVTDGAGNTATCSFNVTVNDTEAPFITCAGDMVVNACGASVVTYAAPIAMDSCPGTTITQTAGLASGSEFPAGVTTNTFVATDAAGNTATCSFTVTVEPVGGALVATATLDADVSCNGGSNGAATASITGGAAPYTYAWSNSADTASITGVVAGEYTVVITDANGCTATASVTVSEPAMLVASASAQTNNICNGISEGSATVAVTGGTTPYEYSWSPMGGTDATATGLAAGTYTVTVTDANGCTATQSFTITEPVAFTAEAVADANVGCFGGNDGAATVNVTGGVAPLSYLWSNNATTASISGLVAETYDVTVTDANGCTATASVTITQPEFVVAPTAADQVFCNSATVSQLVATGTNIKWYAAATGGTQLAGTAALVNNTTYYASQTIDGCESPDRTAVQVTINVTAAPSAPAQTFCNSATVAELVSSGTMPQWYTGSVGGTPLAPDTAIATGVYFVSQTLNGCESPRTAVSVTLNVTAAPVADAQTFCNTATVSNLVATGTAIKWYANATGGSQLLPSVALSTGTYYVSQTLNGCESPRVAVSVTVNVTAAPTAVSQTFCNSAMVSDLVATGAGTIMWYASATGGTALAADTMLTTATTYYASQTISGCESATRTPIIVTINVVNAPTAAATQTFCSGAMVSDLAATGTGTIMWYSTATGGTALAAGDMLTAGMYYAGQMVGSCESATRTAVDVTVNAELLATISSQTNVSCNGGSNGSATVNVEGGAAPYTYLWSNSADTASVTDIMAGTYTVTVTDAIGCVSTVSVTISEPAALVASITVDSEAGCFGSSNGALTVNVSGGTGIYTYAWSNSADTASLTGLAAGTYDVTVTDENGCTVTASATVSQSSDVVAPTGAATQVVGPNATFADLTVEGTGIVWYASEEDAASHQNPLDPATILEDATTYYATQTVDGCESTVSLAVTVTVDLGTDRFEKDKLTYYPVPVADILTIENTNMITNVTVVDMLGQVVLTQKVNALKAQVDMRSLQGATYMVQVETEYGVKTVKVVKSSVRQ